MAAIANGGKLMRPFVVKTVVDQYGRSVRETRPQTVRRVISAETAQKAARILEGVVSQKGTAATAAINGFRAAGKTGTSQKVDPQTRRYSQKQYAAVFVGFVPVENPRLAILVMIDEPTGTHYGGLVAAPVFREVGTWTVNHLQINPDQKPSQHVMEEAVIRPNMESATVPVSEPLMIKSENNLLPDFSGQSMREVFRTARALGLEVVPEGTGLAVRQIPGPGTLLQEIRVVKVDFRPPM
jgi:cell division protein FtsI (penicillin-binding protein 3)